MIASLVACAAGPTDSPDGSESSPDGGFVADAGENATGLVETTFGPAAVRQYADSTYARSCLDYLNPASPYAYAGATGDGDYLIDIDGPVAGGKFPMVVY